MLDDQEDMHSIHSVGVVENPLFGDFDNPKAKEVNTTDIAIVTNQKAIAQNNFFPKQRVSLFFHIPHHSCEFQSKVRDLYSSKYKGGNVGYVAKG